MKYDLEKKEKPWKAIRNNFKLCWKNVQIVFATLKFEGKKKRNPIQLPQKPFSAISIYDLERLQLLIADGALASHKKKEGSLFLAFYATSN